MNQIVDKIMNVEAFNMPIGKAILLTAAFGLANGLSSTVDRLIGGRIPSALVLQTGVAAAIENIGPIKNFLGPDVADLISVAALTAGINSQFNVSGRVVELVNQITTFLPGMSSPQTSAVTNASVESAANTSSPAMSGYQMGAYASQPKTQLPNVDDVDLALLSARGYQTA